MEHLLWCTGNTLLNEYIVKADNCYLYDTTGQKYVDLESGMWATPLGHNNPRILKTIQDQAGMIIHNGFSYVTPVVEEAAKEIIDTLGFIGGKCVFHNSGSEAVEFGAKIIKTINKRTKLLVLKDSFLGAYGTVGQRRSDEWYEFDWSKCSGCAYLDSCDTKCKHIKEIPFDEIGGFVFEPGSAGGRIAFPPKYLIQTITELIRQNNGLTLVNEITTGVGRTGEWFGFQHYDIEPDIVAMGKGLGNGYPVSTVAITKNTADSLNNCTLKHSQSHQNDPFGAAVALEVFRTIKDEHLIERSKHIGEYLIQELKKIAKRYNVIKEVRGSGLMIAVEFLEENDNFATYVFKKLYEQRFIVGKRSGMSVLRIDMALTVPEKEVENFLACFEQILNES